MTWKEITTSDDYKKLPPNLRSDLKQTFFQSNIAPSLKGASEQDLGLAFQDWMETPDDTGEGYVTSLASSAARGLLRPVSDIPIAVGALTGSEGIESFGQDIQAGIESALPVNPAQEGVGTELASLGGQVGSILLGGGGGALAGRALAGTTAAKLGAKAAVGTQAFTGGAAGGAQAADQLGLEGGQKQLRALLGGVTELGVEAIPFGMAAETGAVRKLLGDTVESGWMSPVIKGAGTEAVEEGTTETIGQATDIAFAPDKAQMDLKQIGKAMLLGGVRGAMKESVEAAITPRTKRAFDGTTDFIPSTTPPPGMDVIEADKAGLLVVDGGGAIIGYRKPPTPVTTETIEAELPVELVTPETTAIIDNVVATPEASATAAALARTAVELGTESGITDAGEVDETANLLTGVPLQRPLGGELAVDETMLEGQPIEDEQAAETEAVTVEGDESILDATRPEVLGADQGLEVSNQVQEARSDEALKQKEQISVAEDAVVADGGAMLDEDTQVSPEPTGALPTESLPATGQPTLGSVGVVGDEFVRQATTKERKSEKAKASGYDSIPERPGFEVVFKPYGEQGTGYYYSPLATEASRKDSKRKDLTVKDQERLT